jgi:hypothetical protein
MEKNTRVRQVQNGKPVGRVLVVVGPAVTPGLWEYRPEDSHLGWEVVVLKANQIIKE